MSDIRTVRGDKGECMLRVSDLLYLLCNYNANDADRDALLDQIISLPDFASAFERVLAGVSDDADSEGAKKLRLIFTQCADDCIKELVHTLLNEISSLKQRVLDTEKHRDEILKLWPEGFQKYIPQKLLTYGNYVDSSVSAKLVEHVKAEATKEEIPV